MLSLLTMFNVLQNYKFESNSQPSLTAPCQRMEMFNVLQNYKFESNSQHHSHEYSSAI